MSFEVYGASQKEGKSSKSNVDFDELISPVR